MSGALAPSDESSAGGLHEVINHVSVWASSLGGWSMGSNTNNQRGSSFPGGIPLATQVKAESGRGSFRRWWPRPFGGGCSCHQGVRQLQGEEIYILFPLWGLNFPICIMGLRLFEEPLTQTCVQNMA